MDTSNVFDLKTGEPILSDLVLNVVSKQYEESRLLNHEAKIFAQCLEKRLVAEMLYVTIDSIKGALHGIFKDR